MGVLEILAERSLGTKAFRRHAALRPALSRLDRKVSHSTHEADEFEKERIVSIIRLLNEYMTEKDAEERENILRSLKEIVSNEPLELPAQSLDDWETDLKSTDKEYADRDEKAEKKTKGFLQNYFSLRAKAGLATQEDVARKAGLRRSYVAVIETGEHFPQQKTLQKLAKAFGVDISALA